MHFTRLLSCNFGHDRYNGINIQNEMILEKKTPVILGQRWLKRLNLYEVDLIGPTRRSRSLNTFEKH